MRDEMSVPIAVFHARPQSHPFEERRIQLTEEVKIGRSVARSKPTATNAIFDCKVLSRNHAVMWFEDEKFYIKDTKSSNGTFLNNQRLSLGSQESAPCEVYTGDIIQLGVEVQENNRRGVVTHSCVVATVSLYLPDGQEATRPLTVDRSLLLDPNCVFRPNDLIQLDNYLREAAHREQMLEQKLAHMQRLINNTDQASENCWQALVDEERLLSRLEMLETQLVTVSKTYSEESLKKELIGLQEERANYEITAKESMKKVLEDKLDAIKKASDLERLLSNTEDECAHLKGEQEKTQGEIKALVEQHSEISKELREIKSRTGELEQLHREELAGKEAERARLQALLDQAQQQQAALLAKVEALQAETDFTNEQLSALRVRLEQAQKALKEQVGETVVDSNCFPEENSPSIKKTVGKPERTPSRDIENGASPDMAPPEGTDSNREEENGAGSGGVEPLLDGTAAADQLDVTPESASNNPDQTMLGDLSPEGQAAELSCSPANSTLLLDHPISHSSPEKEEKGINESTENYKAQLEETRSQLEESREKVGNLMSQLQKAQMEAIHSISVQKNLQDKLDSTDENLVASLKENLEKSEKRNEESASVINTLKDQLEQLEVAKEGGQPAKQDSLLLTKLPQELQPKLTNHLGEMDDSEAMEDTLQTPTNDSEEYLASFSKKAFQESQEEIIQLKEQISDLREKRVKAEDETSRLKRVITEYREVAKEQESDIKMLKNNLQTSQESNASLDEHAQSLQDQLNKAEVIAKEVRDQVLMLEEKLEEEQAVSKSNHDEVVAVKKLLSDEREQHKLRQNSLQDIEGKLQETQQLAKKHFNEAEQLRQQVSTLRKELEQEKLERQGVAKANKGLQKEVRRKEESGTKSKDADDDLVEAAHTETDTAAAATAATSAVNSESLLPGSSSSSNDTAESQLAPGDLTMLKEECSSLRKRLQLCENERNKYNEETKKLTQSIGQFQTSAKSLEKEKNHQRSQESALRKEMEKAANSVEGLEKKCKNYVMDNDELQKQLLKMAEEFRNAESRANMITQVCFIPVLIIILGAIYWIYSSIFGPA